MKLPERISIREVSPRDGLQGEPVQVSVDDKVRLIDMLSSSGIQRINATSFVSPKVVPQMADAEEVIRRIARQPGIVYDASVPNLKGVQRAIAAGVDAIMVFVDASDEANQRSVRRTTDESMTDAEKLIAEARKHGISVAATVGTAFGSPYDEEIPPSTVVSMARRLVAAGASSLALGDTTGEANPRQVTKLAGILLNEFPDLSVALHLHDTRGLAMANAVAAMTAGITHFDASVGGIGGNPFLHNTAGNLCTEDLVDMCNRMGIETGVDIEILLDAHEFLESVLAHPLPGKVGHVLRPAVRKS